MEFIFPNPSPVRRRWLRCAKSVCRNAAVGPGSIPPLGFVLSTFLSASTCWWLRCAKKASGRHLVSQEPNLGLFFQIRQTALASLRKIGLSEYRGGRVRLPVLVRFFNVASAHCCWLCSAKNTRTASGVACTQFGFVFPNPLTVLQPWLRCAKASLRAPEAADRSLWLRFFQTTPVVPSDSLRCVKRLPVPRKGALASKRNCDGNPTFCISS